MKIQVSKNQNFESFIDIPDEYYKILSTWKKKNVGSWYRPITNQDNEAMQYLVGIISGSFYKDCRYCMQNTSVTFPNFKCTQSEENLPPINSLGVSSLLMSAHISNYLCNKVSKHPL